MPRADIWQDGINTRFSPTNQPSNRGRKKGRRNRLTILRLVLGRIQEFTDAFDQQRRDHRNARRRERYQVAKGEANKKAGDLTTYR